MGLRSLWKRVRAQLSYANVMATIAVFLALGGTTIAISLPKKSVGPKQLKKNAVKERHIQPAAVSTDKLADGSVTTGKLGDRAVTTGKLGDGAVATGKLGDGAVTEAKINPNAIPLLGTLRPGQTVRGSFNAGGYATVVDDATRQGISYPFPLPEAVPSTVLGLSDPTTATCPSRNPPQAAVNRLCIYVNGVGNVEGSTVAAENVGAFGFGIRVDATAAGMYGASGNWAVTATPVGTNTR